MSISQISQLVHKLEQMLASKQINTGGFVAAITIAVGHASSNEEIADRCGCSIDTAARWTKQLWQNDLIIMKNGQIANLHECMIIECKEKTNIHTEQTEILKESNTDYIQSLDKLQQRARKIADLSHKIANIMQVRQSDIAKVLGRHLPDEFDEGKVLYLADSCKKEFDNPQDRPIDPQTGLPDAIKNLIGYYSRTLERTFADKVIYINSHLVSKRKKVINETKPEGTIINEYEKCKENLLNFRNELGWKRSFTALFKSAEKKLTTEKCLGLAENLLDTVNTGSFILDEQVYQVEPILLQRAVGDCGSTYKPYIRYIYKRYDTLASTPKSESTNTKADKTKWELGVDFTKFREN